MKTLKNIEWIKNHHQALSPFGKGKPTLANLQEMFYGKEGSIYIHIPYCLKICKFCILIKKPGKPNPKYVDTLLKELSMYENYKVVRSLYFGGGTPTLLSVEEFERILTFIQERFGKPEETTVETTVTEFNKEKAECLSSLGVNRLSFGVQTFNESERYLLGRRRSIKEVIKKIKLAKDYFKIVAIDLLYDLPYGNFLLDDVKKAVELGINGISIYPLVYNKSMKNYPHPDVKKNERDFIEAYNFLKENGYSHLSINHFSDGTDKFLSSSSFTAALSLLGIGCGAAGHVENISFFHIPIPYLYSRGIFQIVKTKTPEEVLKGKKFISQLFNGVLVFNDFSVEDFKESVSLALSNEWAELNGKKLTLLPKGLFWKHNLAHAMAKEFLNKWNNRYEK